MATSIDKFNVTLRQRIGNDAIYGSGVDGDVTIAANTTLLGDAYYNNLTVNSNCILNTNGFRVFVKGTLTLDGFIGIGALSGGVIGEPAADVATKTLAGHTTGAITYRLGGTSGGSTSSGTPVLPGYLVNRVQAIAGAILDANTGGTNLITLAGGEKGTIGSTGTTTPALTNSDSWPGKTGATGTPGNATGSTGVANPYKDTVGVPGGKGNPGADGNVTGATSGPGGLGGTGGSGGPVVCVIAKTVAGSGKIVALGRSGGVGSAGTAGNTGSTGANGGKAPDRAYHVPPVANHVAPTSHPNPSTFNPDHHNHTTRHSDWHGHAVRDHGPHCCASHDSKHGHHYPGHNHYTPNFHHVGHFHGPANGNHGIGTAHHWNPHWWHAYFQISHHYPFPHYHSNPMGHHSHYDPPGHAHHHQMYYHGNFWWPGPAQGHNNQYPNGNDFGYHTHPNNHSPQFGAHSHGTYASARYSHTPVPPTSHPNPPTHTAQPDGHFTGGAGGVNDGVNYGKGAPAVTGGTGKRGGAGGGGVVVLVTDSVSGTITYDTRAGLTDSSDTYAAANGAAYVIINS